MGQIQGSSSGRSLSFLACCQKDDSEHTLRMLLWWRNIDWLPKGRESYFHQVAHMFPTQIGDERLICLERAVGLSAQA